MMSNFVLVIILAIAVSKSYSVQEEYHWQDYDGVVPEDAIVAGYDKNGDNVYIAQAKVENNLEEEGIIVTSLHPKVPYVTVPLHTTIIRVESGIKILCGLESSVEWLQATAENLHVVLIGKNPVQGGRFFNDSLHIGRIFYDNGIQIGPVLSYSLNRADLALVHKDDVLMAHTYEVLVYGFARGRPSRRGPKRSRIL